MAVVIKRNIVEQGGMKTAIRMWFGNLRNNPITSEQILVEGTLLMMAYMIGEARA